MSKVCPKCAKELEDDALVCDSCGEELAVEEAAAEAAEEIEAEAAEVAEEAEAEVEETTETEAESEADTETNAEVEPEAAIDVEAEDAGDAEPATDEAAVDEAAAEDIQPADVTVPAKKQKSFGLGMVIGAVIAVFVAAIICGAIMLISGLSGPASTLDKYIGAYKAADYETYFSLDYSVMFKYKDLEDRVTSAQQYGDTGADSLETSILSAVSLSKEAKDSMIEQLETNTYEDIDKIQDIQVLLLQVSRPSETDEAKKDVWVSSVYAIKVDGNWYFASSF